MPGSSLVGSTGLLWGGVLMGLAVAAPLGPVNVEIIRRGLRYGFRAALLAGIGSTVADLVYILIAYAGADPLSHQEGAKRLLFGLGALVLCYLGVAALREALHPPGVENTATIVPTTGPRGSEARGAFSAGFVITILNPMTIAFWLGILAAALAARPRQGIGMELLYVASLAAGCLLWVLGLAIALHLGRAIVRGPALRVVSGFAGLTLIGFGLQFFTRAVGVARGIP